MENKDTYAYPDTYDISDSLSQRHQQRQNLCLQRRLSQGSVSLPPNIQHCPPPPTPPKRHLFQWPTPQRFPPTPRSSNSATPPFSPSSCRYNGRCKICEIRYHREENCFFLMKVYQALAYLVIDPNSPQLKHNQYQRNTTYDRSASTIRSQQ